MALKYKRILLKLSGEVLKGSSDSCHDETILAEVAQPFDAREAIRLMGQGTVALFAGDTGNPFFSTDSGAALRAAEIGANALLKATKVDGVYSADPATGRIAESDGFAWDYLAGSNLKSKLTYPNGATASWDYEANRDLLTKVTNAHADGTGISSYTYTNDLLGRRTSKNDEQYGYNVRDELIAADEVSYAYDDIGNRTTAEGKTYTANNLNQYTAIDDFAPQYDADGNQTLIKTETGIWPVTYNAENRPIRWTQGDTIVTMAFDRLGRRVDYQETQDDQVTTHFRFVYDNFLCVQRLNAANGNAVRTEFVWDPTEPIATRPLVMRAKNWGLNLFYTHDGNKNVSEVFYHAPQNGIAAHYDCAPFGAVSRTSRATRVTNRDLLSENPFRFSSEVHDSTLGLVYYNYRHYHSVTGRWLARDTLETKALFLFSDNSINKIDYLGREPVSLGIFIPNGTGNENTHFRNIASNDGKTSVSKAKTGKEILDILKEQTLSSDECCIRNLTFAGHGWAYNGSSSPQGDGILGADAGSSGLYLNKRDPSSATLSELGAEIQNGTIRFCEDCRIQIYACRISDDFTNKLAKVTGCGVIAARGACHSDPQNNTWLSGTGSWMERKEVPNSGFSLSYPNHDIPPSSLGPAYKPRFN